METFHNPSATTTLRFEVGGVVYHVPPRGNVHLPRRLAYVVKSRGLQLVPGPSPLEEAPEAEERPHRPPPVVVPRGVERGPRKEEDEDGEAYEDDHDAGPELSGDDAEEDGDPIARTLGQLSEQGVDTSLLEGKARKRKKG